MGLVAFAALQRLLSPLLALPHAAAASSVSLFLIGAVGLDRPQPLAGWGGVPPRAGTAPPDLLDPAGPLGPLSDRRAGDQGGPVPAADGPRRPAADRPGPQPRRGPRRWATGGSRGSSRQVFPPLYVQIPSAGLRYAGLCHVDGGCGDHPRAPTRRRRCRCRSCAGCRTRHRDEGPRGRWRRCCNWRWWWPRSSHGGWREHGVAWLGRRWIESGRRGAADGAGRGGGLCAGRGQCAWRWWGDSGAGRLAPVAGLWRLSPCPARRPHLSKLEAPRPAGSGGAGPPRWPSPPSPPPPAMVLAIGCLETRGAARRPFPPGRCGCSICRCSCRRRPFCRGCRSALSVRRGSTPGVRPRSSWPISRLRAALWSFPLARRALTGPGMRGTAPSPQPRGRAGAGPLGGCGCRC